jgi:DNA-binding transcriptional LysR family regulator
MMSDLPLDPVLLRSFVVVARCRGFSEAGRRLGLGQSTVSQHVGRLETAIGRRLFIRDTHRVVPTPDGEALLGFAATILDADERARRHFAGSELRGRVRFGASDDFVLSRLPEVLRDFTQRHLAVDLELTVALSGELFQMLEAGDLDLVLAKRRSSFGLGRPVWRENLLWVAAPATVLDPARPVPLILYKPPSITRTITTEALDRAGTPWRIACTCGSLIGLRAATFAGLGVMAQAESMVPPGLVAISASSLLPDLGQVDFVLAGRGERLTGPAAALAAAIEEGQDRLQAQMRI